MISPQGKERNSVCGKIMYFLLEAVKHSLAVLVLVEDNLHFQGVLIFIFLYFIFIFFITPKFLWAKMERNLVHCVDFSVKSLL